MATATARHGLALTRTRPGVRTVTAGDHQAFLAGRLTPRDRWLARLLADHKVLTTDQIIQLGWPTRRAANHRLRRLYLWRVLDRFQPLVPTGAAPAHYVLDVAGAGVLAHEDGLDPDQTGYRHDRALGIAHSPRLAHTLAVNNVFVSLIAHARQPGATGTLTAWWSETRCLHAVGDLARPDAYGAWREHGTDIGWYLELDRGTEPLRRLAAKLTDYHALATTTGTVTPVLVWLPSAQRETGARRALTEALADLDRPATVPVATTATDLVPPGARHDPAAARWLPLTPRATPGRLRLTDLAHAWPHLRPASQTDPPARPGKLAPAPPMPPDPASYPPESR
ncbi:MULTISPECIES: replication-relaxation family protein [Protofrankia]|uniref:replication-relaxation family protein n=1 Tax=Protofrankia TaxID=2994361 RepID=UPI0006403C68|nr:MULTISPECIES: replication-relaxation family protein [Protofrankia]ONH34189.1 hypothetical protein BL254_17500 [Protofrankia sp. BMG5.30]